MDMQDIGSFAAQAILFYIVYKLGQLHGSVKVVQHLKEQTTSLQSMQLTSLRPIITIEEINGIYYAYDGNDFLAQGNTPDELGKSIATRFPNKYHLAKIEMKV